MAKAVVTLVTASFALAVSAGAALAIEVKKAVTVSAEPDAVWEEIGDWCAIESWHPAIAECEEMEDTKRVLTTGDGAKIHESRTGMDDMSYSYVITESPLPVENYKSTLRVRKAKDGGTRVVWEATFDPKGDAKKAEETIAGIFQAGVDAIKKKLDK